MMIYEPRTNVSVDNGMHTLQGINIFHLISSIFEDYFPFPQVGYVNFQEGIHPCLFSLVDGPITRDTRAECMES